MKSELFELNEISTPEALLFVQVGKEMGLSAKAILKNMHCIDELLIHERSKMLVVQRACDRKQSKKMIENIIETYL
jgi:hypothetical protein